jgi:hypothetical protein
MGEYYNEADPIYLCRAICIVHERWIKAGKHPGSDNLLNSTRTRRPALVAEITEEWERLADVDPCEDLFPYHESYVIRKWVDFRKMPNPRKRAWIAAAKEG